MICTKAQSLYVVAQLGQLYCNTADPLRTVTNVGSLSGVTFAAELIMSWNVAFVATRNLRKRIVLKRRNIAHFYIWHGTFIFDTISTLVFIIQVLLLLLLLTFLKALCMRVTLQHIACLLLSCSGTF